MKIIFDGDCFTVFVLRKDNIVDMTKYMKNLVLKLRKKYRKDISGFYKVDVYLNEKIGLIAHFFKEDELEFFRDIIDLKVTVFEDACVFLEFDDYFLLCDKNVYFWKGKYYIDLDDVSLDEFYGVVEFCKFVFGYELDTLKSYFDLVVKN